MQASKQTHRFVLFLGALAVAACASHRGGSAENSWPAANPFQGAEKLSATDWAQSHKLPAFELVFSGNVNGETEPCGCALNPKGGLDRRLNFLRSRKAQAPRLIVDGGNTFFPSKSLASAQEKFLKARAELVARGHRLMKVDAQNVGHLDWAAGPAFLKSVAKGLPLVSASWTDDKGKLLFPAEKVVTVGQLKLHVLGLSRMDEGDELPAGVALRDPEEALKDTLSKIPAQEAVVVLSDLGYLVDQKLAQATDRPLIFVGSRDLSSLELPMHEGRSILVQGQLQGQQWGLLQVAWGGEKMQGWYNVSAGRRFESRWTSLLQDREVASNRGDRDESQRVQGVADDMLRYAPGKLEEKNVYDYELADMSVEFAKPNELTAAMASIRNRFPAEAGKKH